MQPSDYYGFFLLLAIRCSHGLHTLFSSADETSLGTTRHFLSIYLPHLLQLIPSSYWTNNLLDLILRKDNLNSAYKQVKKNKGKGGIDGMQVDELLPFLRENQDTLIQEIVRPIVCDDTALFSNLRVVEHFCILFLFRRYHLQIVLYMKLSVLISTFSYFHCLCHHRLLDEQSFGIDLAKR